MGVLPIHIAGSSTMKIPSKIKQKPKILRSKSIARTRLFNVEELDLEFSNGETRTYERLVAGQNGAVMIVPILDNSHILLIREYSAGTDDYQLAFPKGLIEKGETPEQAANRELKEEVGHGAKTISALKKMTLAPGYLTHKMNLLLAEDLYPETAEGDEPEPLELVKWPLEDIDHIVEQPDFTEARSIAALYLVKDLLNRRAS